MKLKEMEKVKMISKERERELNKEYSDMCKNYRSEGCVKVDVRGLGTVCPFKNTNECEKAFFYESGYSKAIDDFYNKLCDASEYARPVGWPKKQEIVQMQRINSMVMRLKEKENKRDEQGITADKNFARGIANFTEKHLKNNLIRIAEENWTDSQVKMLKGLICAAVNGIEYADAYEAVNKD